MSRFDLDHERDMGENEPRKPVPAHDHDHHEPPTLSDYVAHGLGKLIKTVEAQERFRAEVAEAFAKFGLTPDNIADVIKTVKEVAVEFLHESVEATGPDGD